MHDKETPQAAHAPPPPGSAGSGRDQEQRTSSLRGKRYDQQVAMLAPNDAPVQMLTVYRGGTSTDSNLTPRPDKDTTGNKRGLSTFETLEEAARPGDKAQKINTDSLTDLDAVQNGSGGNTHVSIRPDKDEDLVDWANSRGGDKTHPHTTEVRGAIAEEVKRPKN